MVLCWRRPLPVLLQRLVITAAVSVMVAAVARWLINPDDSVWLVYRSVQLLWMLALTGWALLVRIVPWRGLLRPRARSVAANRRDLTVLTCSEFPTVSVCLLSMHYAYSDWSSRNSPFWWL